MSLLNSVHVEELLELDVSRLLHEEDQDKVDEVDRLRVIDRMSLLEFSAPKCHRRINNRSKTRDFTVKP